MKTIEATEARARLHGLMNTAAESHEPLLIVGKTARCVLVSEYDWRAIQEALFLLSVPGMRESIREGMEAAVEDCDEVLDW